MIVAFFQPTYGQLVNCDSALIPDDLNGDKITLNKLKTYLQYQFQSFGFLQESLFFALQTLAWK